MNKRVCTRSSGRKSAAVVIALTLLCWDAQAQTVKGSVTLKSRPEQIAINSVNNHVYVATPNFGREPFDYLTIIDGRSDTVIRNIEIPPVAYAVAADTFAGLVYVGGSYEDKNGLIQNNVVVIREETATILEEVHISSTEGDGVQGMVIDPSSGDVYVSNGSDNEVDLIHEGKIAQRISMSAEPYGIAINPLLSEVYVSLLDGHVSVLDTKTNRITNTTHLGTSTAGIAADVVHGKVYAASAVAAANSTLRVLGESGKTLASVPVGDTAIGVDVDPGTGLAFIANTQDASISVVDEATNRTVRSLPVSGLFLAVNPVTSKVYVGANDGSPSLTVINER